MTTCQSGPTFVVSIETARGTLYRPTRGRERALELLRYFRMFPYQGQRRAYVVAYGVGARRPVRCRY